MGVRKRTWNCENTLQSSKSHGARRRSTSVDKRVAAKVIHSSSSIYCGLPNSTQGFCAALHSLMTRTTVVSFFRAKISLPTQVWKLASLSASLNLDYFAAEGKPKWRLLFRAAMNIASAEPLCFNKSSVPSKKSCVSVQHGIWLKNLQYSTRTQAPQKTIGTSVSMLKNSPCGHGEESVP